MNTQTQVKKKKSHAFRKDIYLLGIDSEGQNVWIEAPSWDCGWYWGFGYVERYTNNRNPEKAKDITSHTHIDSEFKTGDAINVNTLARRTFTKNEGIELNRLFTEFYDLQKEAGAAHNNDIAKWEKLNQVTIPTITDAIIKILTPNN